MHALWFCTESGVKIKSTNTLWTFSFFFFLHQVGGLNDSNIKSLSHAVQYIDILYIYIKIANDFIVTHMPLSHNNISVRSYSFVFDIFLYEKNHKLMYLLE